MLITSKVIWSEGMFLHPHHFQQQDRYLEHLIFNQIRATHPYYWGVMELAIDEQLLSLGKFALTACCGVLPDGTFFNIPTYDKTPLPIDITQEETNAIICIGAPVRLAGIPEVTLDTLRGEHSKSRYHAETIEVNDGNIGSEMITPIQIGKLQLRLLSSNHDNKGFEYLGLARIKEVRADRKVILDEEYIPTCLNTQAIPLLSQFLQELQGLLYYRGNILMQRLTAHETAGLSEATDFMLLQIMNRFEPWITHLTQAKSLHPEQLFSILIRLVGELATFTTRERRPITLPLYLHHDLTSAFLPIIQELRKNLSIVIEETAIGLKLEQQQPNTWISTIHDKSTLDKSSFILAVHADLPQEDIVRLFPAQSKVAPVEQLQQLVIRSLSGIELSALTTAPRQIPYHAKYVYFLLDKNSALWQQLKNSAALAIHVGAQFPGLNVKLWAIKDKDL